MEEEEAQPGVARGRGTLSGPAWGRQLRGVRGAVPRGIRVRGRGAGGLEAAVVPSNLWSSTSMFLGNIQVNDMGEASQEEEDDPGVSQDEEAAAGASSQEETEELDL